MVRRRRLIIFLANLLIGRSPYAVYSVRLVFELGGLEPLQRFRIPRELFGPPAVAWEHRTSILQGGGWCL